MSHLQLLYMEEEEEEEEEKGVNITSFDLEQCHNKKHKNHAKQESALKACFWLWSYTNADTLCKQDAKAKIMSFRIQS